MRVTRRTLLKGAVAAGAMLVGRAAPGKPEMLVAAHLERGSSPRALFLPVVQKGLVPAGDWQTPIREVMQQQPRHETPHFAVYTDPGYLDAGELQQIGNLLERAFEQSTSFLGIAYDSRARKIWTYFRSAPGLSFSTPTRGIVFSGYRNILRAAPGAYIVHEVAHVVTGRHEDYLIRHLDAPYLEQQFTGLFTLPACGFQIHLQAAALVEAGRLVPIAEIPADPYQWGFGRGRIDGFEDPQRVHRFYTEAGSFGQYLIESYGVEALARLRSRPDRAWTAAYAKPLGDLEQGWLDVLGQVRQANAALVHRLAEAARTADPCLASRRP